MWAEQEYAMQSDSHGLKVYGEFNDGFGRGVRVQESTPARPRCVDILHDHYSQGACSARLTRLMAIRLIDALQKFLAEDVQPMTDLQD
jgi:hypothetical protein